MHVGEIGCLARPNRKTGNENGRVAWATLPFLPFFRPPSLYLDSSDLTAIVSMRPSGPSPQTIAARLHAGGRVSRRSNHVRCWIVGRAGPGVKKRCGDAGSPA